MIMNSSRTNLRLQLMREQSMLDEQLQQQNNDHHRPPPAEDMCMSPMAADDSDGGANGLGVPTSMMNHSSPVSFATASSNSHLTTMGGGIDSNGTGGGSHYGGGGLGGANGSSMKSSPIIISQPIRFSGNRLVHLPPQIIHVQQQHQQQSQHSFVDDMGRRNLTLSSSLPPGLPQNPKMPAASRLTNLDNHMGRVTTPNQYGIPQQYRAQSTAASRQSPAELSHDGYESPQSNSFTSAQSELDDVIIDEILSMEEDQRRRDPQSASSKMLNSLSYADNLEALLSSGGNIPFLRQISNSAPTSTIDIEGLVREELLQEQEIMRDRRKKDIHNMIERRRRYNINDRIKELGTMLPKACTEDLKLNKGTILKASVEYIRVLRRDQEKLHQILHRYQNVDHDNKIMAMRIQELEQRLKQSGIPVPPPPPETSSSTSTSSSVAHQQQQQSSSMIDRRQMMDARGRGGRLIDGRPLKSEPLDDDETPQPRPDHPAPAFQTLASLQQHQQQHSIHPHQQQHHQGAAAQLPPLPHGGAPSPMGPPTQQPQHLQQQQQQQSNRLLDYNMMGASGGHNYAISTSDNQHVPSFYASMPSVATAFGSDGLLETPPVVNNNLSVFDGGDRRAPLGLVNQQQAMTRPAHLHPHHQHQQHHQQNVDEIITDLGGGVASSTVGNLVSSSTAALISTSDPLLNTQLASPEVQWDSQAFSPESERMDFLAQ